MPPSFNPCFIISVYLRTENQYPCLVKGCYTADQICDGIKDCDDGYDESGCVDQVQVQQEQVYRYRMSRYGRYDDYYDNWDGDWGWFDANIDEDKEQFIKIPLPPTCDEWYLTAFSVSKEYGIAVYDELIPYDTCRPLWLFCEAPEVLQTELLS